MPASTQATKETQSMHADMDYYQQSIGVESRYDSKQNSIPPEQDDPSPGGSTMKKTVSPYAGRTIDCAHDEQDNADDSLIHNEDDLMASILLAVEDVCQASCLAPRLHDLTSQNASQIWRKKSRIAQDLLCKGVRNIEAKMPLLEAATQGLLDVVWNCDCRESPSGKTMFLKGRRVRVQVCEYCAFGSCKDVKRKRTTSVVAEQMVGSCPNDDPFDDLNNMVRGKRRKQRHFDDGPRNDIVPLPLQTVSKDGNAEVSNTIASRSATSVYRSSRLKARLTREPDDSADAASCLSDDESEDLENAVDGSESEHIPLQDVKAEAPDGDTVVVARPSSRVCKRQTVHILSDTSRVEDTEEQNADLSSPGNALRSDKDSENDRPQNSYEMAVRQRPGGGSEASSSETEGRYSDFEGFSSEDLEDEAGGVELESDLSDSDTSGVEIRHDAEGDLNM